jgi:transcriptional regulator with XRE-family HTH domain
MPHTIRRENTPAWRKEVRDRLTELKKKPGWLAEKAGTSEQTVSRLLRGGSGTSKHIDAISRVLHIPEPYQVAEVAREYRYAGTGKPESCERLALALAVLAIRKTTDELTRALDVYAAHIADDDWKHAEGESVWPVRELVEQLQFTLRAVDAHHANWATDRAYRPTGSRR